MAAFVDFWLADLILALPLPPIVFVSFLRNVYYRGSFYYQSILCLFSIYVQVIGSPE
jgi:hypothetical protein